MASLQTRADLAAKKKKMAMSKIKDIWSARLNITFEGARQVTPVSVDVAQCGLVWEEEFTVPGRGTDVSKH